MTRIKHEQIRIARAVVLSRTHNTKKAEAHVQGA